MEVFRFAIVLCMYFVAYVCADSHGTGEKPKHAKCKIEENIAGRPIKGVIMLKQEEKDTMFEINLTGFDKDDEYTKHGFHIHAEGKLTDDCKDAGGHYNPDGKDHAGPDDADRHVGDLGNVEEKDGKVITEIKGKDVALSGEKSIIGRAIVVHLKEDDIGKGGDAESLKTGNAGMRIACCKIEEYMPPPPETTTKDHRQGKPNGSAKAQYFPLLIMGASLLLAALY